MPRRPRKIDDLLREPVQPSVHTAAPVTVTYRGATREIPYCADCPLFLLLPEAVRAHGLRFATNSHLRLHNADGPLPHEQPASDAGIQPGQTLDLR